MAINLGFKLYGVVLLVLFSAVLGQRGRRCEEIRVPMCRGFLPYNETRLPNRYGHTNQSQIFAQLDLWSHMMDDPCSNNFRLLACGALLPECSSGNEPCKEACLYAKRNCRAKMREVGFRFPRDLKCKRFKRKNTNQCTHPFRRLRTRNGPQLEFHFCEPNTVDLCDGLPFNLGSLPNMFLQSPSEVATEIENFRDLVESGCHEHIRLFTCGVFKPFCPNPNFPQVMPCQSLCNAVKQACQSEYSRLFPGFSWPSKFQCHRYPETSVAARPCFSGNDENPVWDLTEEDSE